MPDGVVKMVSIPESILKEMVQKSVIVDGMGNRICSFCSVDAAGAETCHDGCPLDALERYYGDDDDGWEALFDG